MTLGGGGGACDTRGVEWFIVILVVIGLVAYAQNRRSLGQRREREAAELAVVRRTVEEDVVAFGEDLQRLGDELPGTSLDEGGRADYKQALDAYDAAKQATDSLTAVDQTRHVASIIDDGRYAIACVRARVEGRPLPQRRPACFFDPRHGQSVEDVAWAPPGGTTRDVPACALDAERVRAGADPDTRRVLVGTQRVPYYEAGRAFAPMSLGYFGAFGLANSLFLGTTMGMLVGGSYDGMDGEAFDGGGYDADASGGFGGDYGGDFGGGDFGGGM